MKTVFQKIKKIFLVKNNRETITLDIINIEELKNKIINNIATNTLCAKSGKPIFFNDSFYMLACDKYHIDLDIDPIILDVSDGVFSSAQDFDKDEEHTTGYFYISKLCKNDLRLIYNNIIENRFYYNEFGQKVEFSL